MKNEKEKEQSKLLDRAKALAEDVQKRVEKAKVTRTRDRRPKIPAGVPTPPNFSHPRMIKKNGGTVE